MKNLRASVIVGHTQGRNKSRSAIPGMCVFSDNFGKGVVLHANETDLHLKCSDAIVSETVQNISYRPPSVFDEVVFFDQHSVASTGVLCDIVGDTALVLVSKDISMVTCEFDNLCLFDSYMLLT